MAKKPPTPAEIQQGKRMRELRLRFGKGQGDISSNHTEVSNTESGKNNLGGSALLKKYAVAFGVSAEEVDAYKTGELSIDDIVQRSSKPPSAVPQPLRRGRKAAASGVHAPPDPRAETFKKHLLSELIGPVIDQDQADAESLASAFAVVFRNKGNFPNPKEVARELAAIINKPAQPAGPMLEGPKRKR